MEKMSWKPVRHSGQSGTVPPPRWGHSCCVVGEQVFFFGGYADSNYMNDLWCFNTITMQWTELETTGDIPSQRSNSSLNYDPVQHRIVLFGGGGPNKVRFNSLHILDCNTRHWTQVTHRTDQPAPWERTYHTAELFSHYLIVFGGEAIGDLDDLWVYDLENGRWREATVPKTTPRPCARRFHSSAIVNDQFYVIAGCYGKYRCLSDIHSIDLSPLKQGKVEELHWRERKMKDNTFLTRWGHTSAVYQDKICVFGGRFCNDLSDILIIDPAKDQVNILKTGGECPKARRRHSACFLGNSMLVFGGFNGQYFNDLHFIPIKLPTRKPTVESDPLSNVSLPSLKSIKSLQWEFITTITGERYEICIGLLIQRFQSICHFESFLREIDNKFTQKELEGLILPLYRGYGKIDLAISYTYAITLPETREEMLLGYKKAIVSERQTLSVNKRSKIMDPVILLNEQDFSQFLQSKRGQEGYFDVTLSVNDQAFFRANRALLACSSSYFLHLFSSSYGEQQEVIKMPVNDMLLFQTLLNYLSSNFVVASCNATHSFWSGLLQMAEYFSLSHLVDICQHQLLSYVSQYSCEEIFLFSVRMGLSKLAHLSGQHIIRKMATGAREDCIELLFQKQELSFHRQQLLKRIYSLQRFSILQRRMDSQQLQSRGQLKPKQRWQSQQQKQNNQIKN